MNKLNDEDWKRDNKDIESVKIGNQIWMKKNLDVAYYRNGDTIPEVKDPEEWKNLEMGAWCYYNNDTAIGSVYGKLYNWFAVNDPRGLAPANWHIPSLSEWNELREYLGGNDVAGGKSKEAGFSHWVCPNEGATNESGFSALPGGCRSKDCVYRHIGYLGGWWSSIEDNPVESGYLVLDTLDVAFRRSDTEKIVGYSVRCIKD